MYTRAPAFQVAFNIGGFDYTFLGLEPRPFRPAKSYHINAPPPPALTRAVGLFSRKPPQSLIVWTSASLFPSKRTRDCVLCTTR